MRQTLCLILSHKIQGPPTLRAADLDSKLITVLNGVLDPMVFSAEKAVLRENEKADQVSSSREEVLCGTGAHLGRAAINRAMQVSLHASLLYLPSSHQLP